MNKIWFKKVLTNRNIIPCSVEGWIWILLVAGVAYYFGSNLKNGVPYIIGFILTIVIGITIVEIKTK